MYRRGGVGEMARPGENGKGRRSRETEHTCIEEEALSIHVQCMMY